MIAGVVFGQEEVGIFRVTERFVEVDAAVDKVSGAKKFVVGVAHLLKRCLQREYGWDSGW